MRVRTLYGIALFACGATACALSLAGSNADDPGANDGGPMSDGSSATDGGHGGTIGQPDAAPVEDCLNGVDDDGNGKIDCADPACQPAFACVPAPGSQYDRVVAHQVPVDDAGVLPSCGDGGGATLYYESPVTAPPVTCSSCSCGAPVGEVCGTTTITCFDQNGCTGAAKQSFDVGTTCVSATLQNQVKSCNSTNPTLTPGSCGPDGGVPTKSAAFGGAVAVCITPGTQTAGGGGCNAGFVCANTAADAGPIAACLRAPNGTDCPAGWSTVTSMYPAAGVSDTRGCSACSCGGETGGHCNGALAAWFATTCDGLPSAGNVTGNCANISGGVALSLRLTAATPNDGGCPASGGAAQGGVDAGAPQTFCCR